MSCSFLDQHRRVFTKWQHRGGNHLIQMLGSTRLPGTCPPCSSAPSLTRGFEEQGLSQELPTENHPHPLLQARPTLVDSHHPSMRALPHQPLRPVMARRCTHRLPWRREEKLTGLVAHHCGLQRPHIVLHLTGEQDRRQCRRRASFLRGLASRRRQYLLVHLQGWELRKHKLCPQYALLALHQRKRAGGEPTLLLLCRGQKVYQYRLPKSTSGKWSS